MSCQCDFRLVSFTGKQHVDEDYSLPCDKAVYFLNQLSRNLHYTVLYTLQKGDKTYQNTTSETPDLAAAKINLFMMNLFPMAKDLKR